MQKISEIGIATVELDVSRFEKCGMGNYDYFHSNVVQTITCELRKLQATREYLCPSQPNDLGVRATLRPLLLTN